MQKQFELLVFDWDGTLMDSEAHIVTSMQRAMADAQLPELTREKIRDIIGLGLREAIERLLPGLSEELHLALVDRYRYHFLQMTRANPSRVRSRYYAS